MNSTAQTQNSASPSMASIMDGGEMLTIQTRDGKTQSVKVQLLTVRQCPKLLGLLDDEAAMVELFCGQKEGWADTLTDESLDAILEKGTALNDPTLRRFAARKAKMAKYSVALIREPVAQAMAAAKELETQISKNSAQSAPAS